MAGVRVAHAAGRGLEDRQHDGRQDAVAEPQREAVQPLGHRAAVVGLHEDRAQRAAHLAHRRGRLDAAPDDVADDDRHAPAGQRDRVVPVAADLGAVVAGLIARGERDAGHLRQAGRQQRALQLLGDPPLLLVQARAGDRQARASRRQAEQIDRLGIEVVARERRDVQAADDLRARDERHAEQRADRRPERARVDARGGHVEDRHRPALARDELDDVVGVRAAVALHDGRDATGGPRDERAGVAVGQHDGRTVDVERVEQRLEHLAQQPLEVFGTERRDGDRLHEPQPLGCGLGLRARVLGADQLLAVALGPAALAQVLDVEDEVRRRAVARRRQRDADEHRDRRAGGTVQPPLDLVAGDRPGRELVALAVVDAALAARAELVERAPDEVLGPAADRLAQRAVDVAQAPGGVGARHPDRRVLERRAQQLLALDERPPALVALDEDLDLRAQHDGIQRLEEIVDGSRLIAAKDVVGLLADRRHEDDRHGARALAGADQLGGLEAVQPRHLDVEQDHREVVAQQCAQRLVAGARLDQAAAQRCQHGLQRDEVLLAVVDEQDRAVSHCAAPSRAATSSTSSGPISASGRMRASGVTAIAASGISRRSALSGSCTIAVPPRRAIRARPSAPSAFAPVSTTPATCSP